MPLTRRRQQRVKSHSASPQAPEADSPFDPSVSSIQDAFKRGKQEVSLIAQLALLFFFLTMGVGGEWSFGSHFARKSASFLSSAGASEGAEKLLLAQYREKDGAQKWQG